jgi:hypothetical protein
VGEGIIGDPLLEVGEGIIGKSERGNMKKTLSRLRERVG